jgi:predicted TPR repeat methyltransferase
MQTVYLVFEEGNGYIHKAFQNYADAEKLVRQLQEDTGFECFEILDVPFVSSQLVTLQELADSGVIPD